MFATEAEEARALVEMIDEAINRGDAARLRAIVGKGHGAEVRDLADVIVALEALRERIWIYRISRQLRGGGPPGEASEAEAEVTPAARRLPK